MALPDLTGQFIQDTYQRVLQVSSSGDMVDGTGSLFIPPTASYAISASHEIIKEISSSYADTASYAISSSYADTASYAISSSYADTASYAISASNGGIFEKSGSFYSTTNDLILTGSLSVSKDIEIEGDISASGNIKFTTTENQTLSNIALYDTSSGELFYAPSSIFEGDDNSTNPNSTLSQELKPNLSVGGISTQDTFSQGSTIENLLRKMLITFKVSSLGTLTLKNGNSSVGLGIKEVNSSFTFDNVSISSNDNDPNSNYPLALSFQSFGIPTGDINETFNDTPLTSNDNFSFPSKTVDVLSITGRSKQVSFNFKAKDPDSDQILNKSTSATFIYPMYWGHSSEDYFNTGNVEDILPKQLSTRFSSKSIHFNFTNEYIYFCVPETYGTLKKVEDGNGFDSTDSFVKITRPQAGSAGWNGVSYNIYKTNLTSVNNQTFKFYL